jgi:hypothetical protein
LACSEDALIKTNTLYYGHKKTLAVETSQGFLFGWKTVAVSQQKPKDYVIKILLGTAVPVRPSCSHT